MSAADYLSPDQFGFKEASYDDWDDAMLSHMKKTPTPGKIDPSMELHTAQDHISRRWVEVYAKDPEVVAVARREPIELFHHEGRVFVGNGHHRLAAARQKGQKSIAVMNYGLDK